MSLFSELKQRNVFRVGIVYLVVGWVLIQVADVMAPQMNLPEWTARMITFVVMLGFPVSLVMAWALELTPEGVKKASGSNVPIYIFAMVLAGLSFYWFFDTSVATTIQTTRTADLNVPISITAENTGPPSIAIIPFENMSGDEANDPFTLGIHDDLLTKVSKINSIRTISRTSVLRFNGSEQSIPEIAAELGVNTILEGGVQRIGNSVRINVQLIDAATDEHIWAETYDRDLTAANVFAIQSEISASIAEALKTQLSDDEHRRLRDAPTDNLEALEAYFVGKQLADTRSEYNIKEAIIQFDRAVELDSDFALAHAGLAYAWLLMPEYSASVDRELTRTKSQAAMTRALELDPELPAGLVSEGWSRMVHEYNWDEAESLLRQALEIQGNYSDALHWLSHVLSFQGRHDEALVIAQQAIDADPLSPLMNMNLSYIQMDARLFDQAIKTRDRTMEMKSDMSEQMRNIWLTFLRAGRYGDGTIAFVAWARGTGRDTNDALRFSQLLEQFPETGQMVELPRELIDQLEIGTENLGQAYAAAGDAESALKQLRIALDERAGSRSVLSMKVNPLYDFFRDDPRFVQLMKEANLAP